VTPDAVPTLDPDLLYEECPDCPEDGFCLTCFDEELVVHDCEGDDGAAA
jgi:hypothetical protein